MSGFFTSAATERSEKALAAYRAFVALKPVLTAYARILTKNPRIRIKVTDASNGSTDGTTIFYRPPIVLGEKHVHQAWLCDKRDEKKMMPARPARSGNGC